ncbi:globin domain-containing protein [Streptomyces morookaense]|uniref:nitric oxide dioxygenase n=1 Tax=Streptomyces morookaense TaxID=1970 RepID=A0A7Y7AZS8_STRMO|nr:globin domain-containing protein [Streptomyces morookaense]NVK76194.1 hemin transporter [Streptomyces morookaense]GHF38059.1 hemin transporter [Streptomyces morookaense]
MLSPKSTEVVRATLPAVGGAIGEITPLFYDKLFAAHPGLLRDLFNRGNQANGSQQQALAGAVAAFASALVEHPDVRPDAMLARIAHKHASLGIAPEQYPIVQEHLFAAIVEVLGDAVTPEVAAAWDEVYWLMANALIALEARLYEEAGTAPGRAGFPCEVVGRFRETDDVTTFVVQPTDGRPVPAGRPGQYVSVQVTLADGAQQIRQYSLSGQPEGALQFSVKRVGDGEVSAHLHDRVKVGDTILVSAPFGDVTLEDGDAPVLLASAGIGCTPIVGMLTHLAATEARRKVIAVHADRSPSTHAFRSDLRALVAKLPDAEAHVWYEEPEAEWPADRTGLVDLSSVEIPAGTVAYLCGPLPFMRAARAQLLEAGIAAADIHYEVFGPDLWLGAEG